MTRASTRSQKAEGETIVGASTKQPHIGGAGGALGFRATKSRTALAAKNGKKEDVIKRYTLWLAFTS